MQAPIILLALVALAASTGATGCEPTTSPTTLDTGIGIGPRYYVAEDPHWLTCGEFGFPECGSIWIYEETNGIDGLQRDDDIIDDTCGGMIAGDTLSL